MIETFRRDNAEHPDETIAERFLRALLRWWIEECGRLARCWMTVHITVAR